MKKFVSLLLCVSLVLTFVGCSGGETGEQDQIDLSITDELTGTSEDAGGALEVTASKDALNPLTGVMNLPSDRVGMRPYAIAIDNSDYNGKPQDGISKADIIVEIETEAGITRLMALFADTREVERIGPLRSLRDQFLELVFPLDPIVAHIGTSVLADKAINENAFRTLDGNNVPAFLWKWPNRSEIVNTYFTSGSLIDEALAEENMKSESGSTLTTFFNFAAEDETIVPDDGTASAVSFPFSFRNNEFDGDFRYDEESEKYLKWQKGKPHIDEAYDDAQLAFDNVFLLYADVTIAAGTEEKGGLIEIDYQSGGTGYYFTKGHYEEITWTKGVYASNIKLFDSDGNELVVNTGNSFIAVVGNQLIEKTEITEISE